MTPFRINFPSYTKCILKQDFHKINVAFIMSFFWNKSKTMDSRSKSNDVYNREEYFSLFNNNGCD